MILVHFHWKIAELSRHQNGWFLQFLMCICSGSNQKKFESALLSLRVWKLTFLLTRFHGKSKSIKTKSFLQFSMKILSKWLKSTFKNVIFQPLRLKSALSKFFWLKTLQLYIRNRKEQPFWCRDNSAILGQNLLFLTPIFDWFLEIFGIFFCPKHQFRYIFSYKINSKFENRF